jgi:hypothetical protein
MSDLVQSKMISAPCSSCVRKTMHDILYETAQHEEHCIDTYALLRCRGCSTISLGHQERWLDDGKTEHTYYPSPVSRKTPDWVIWLTIGFSTASKAESELGSLLTEIYQAVDGGQHRLAAMGIRALLEQVMILKVGDHQTFDNNLDEFQKGGYLSLLQRDAMSATLNVGHAAMHRAFKPTEEDLKVALDVVEGVLAPIFAHKEAAEKLADRIPPRPPRPKKGTI